MANPKGCGHTNFYSTQPNLNKETCKLNNRNIKYLKHNWIEWFAKFYNVTTSENLKRRMDTKDSTTLILSHVTQQISLLIKFH